MSFKSFTIFSPGGHFVQQTRMLGVILVEDNPRNNPMNFEIGSVVTEKMLF